MENALKRTQDTYGLLWQEGMPSCQMPAWHFNKMQEAIPEPIVRGSLGIEVGSGSGIDTVIMAKANPSLKLISLDISDGIFEAGKATASLPNVSLIKASALEVPVRDNVFDFAYSFGVLHHTPDPLKGLKEISRVLKPGSPAFVYLYEDHSDNPVKFISLKLVSLARRITTRLPLRLLNFLCYCASPFVVVLFSYPSRIMGLFKFSRHISDKMPFNFGTHLFSVAGDLYDRFGAPIEFRFSRKEVMGLFADSGFKEIKVSRIKDTAGWVAWGYKSRC